LPHSERKFLPARLAAELDQQAVLGRQSSLDDSQGSRRRNVLRKNHDYPSSSAPDSVHQGIAQISRADSVFSETKDVTVDVSRLPFTLDS
jgi:hypothetical protein